MICSYKQFQDVIIPISHMRVGETGISQWDIGKYRYLRVENGWSYSYLNQPARSTTVGPHDSSPVKVRRIIT